MNAESALFVLLIAINTCAIAQEFCKNVESLNIFSDADIYPVDIGNWYLNLDMPIDCSGRVHKYDVNYFLQYPGQFFVYVALWQLRPGTTYEYDIVNGTYTPINVSISNGGRRRRNTGITSILVNSAFATQGSIVGVYFEPSEFPLSVIGSLPASPFEDFITCKLPGNRRTTRIDCHSHMVTDLAVLASVTISEIVCSQHEVPLLVNADFLFIDGDTQYGDRVVYSCYSGYLQIGGDDFLQCNGFGEWEGTLPRCDLITECSSIDELENGMITGTGYSVGSTLEFACHDGFLLLGNSLITCQTFGIWSGSVPICIMAPPPPPAPQVNVYTTYLLSSPPTGYISPKVISSAALVISNPFTHFSFPFPSNTDPSHSVENSNTGDDNNSYNTAFDSRLQIIAGTLSATILILTSIVILMGCVILIIRRRSKTNSSSEGFFFHGKRQLDDNSCDNPLYAGGRTIVQPMDYEQMVPMKSYNKIFQLEHDSLATSPLPVESSFSKSLEAVTSHNPVYESCEILTSYNQYSSLQHQVGLCVPNNELRQMLALDEETRNAEERIYEQLIDMEQYSVLRKSGRGSFFTEEPIYWEPKTDTISIYDQLAKRKYREIPRQHIKVHVHLGSGQFGRVDKGIWITKSGLVDVAVKTLKGFATEEEEIKFLQEAAINGQFHHPNVIELYGVATVGHPIIMVLEHAENGDLKQFLEGKRPLPGELADDSLPEMLLKFSYQISCGMEYLSKKGFIHRDLAARNILVDSKDNCKIADFGMSKYLQDKAYYKTNSGKIPVKWTAPEAIHFQKYTTQSDVWSYGIVLYEIWSLGHRPFEEFSNQDCIRVIDSGYCLPPPPGCPRTVYEMMITCWNRDASLRPLFSQLVLEFSEAEALSKQTATTHLGAPMEQEDSTFLDLQNKYK